MIPYTTDDGLRGYRAPLDPPVRRPRRRCRAWLVYVLALLFLAFLGGLLCGVRLQAADCVRLQVRPQMLLRTSDVDVQAHVARHPDHRALVIVWNSDVGAAGSRSFDLEGTATDTVLFQWVNRDQPAGHYLYEARVTDAGGRPLGSSRAEIRSVEIAP